MGKEWYWAGRSSKRGGGGAEAETPSGGCMCAVFHFFDFHPFHFPTTNQQQQHQQTTFKSASCIPEDHTTVPKGAEAPRNSLESEDGTVSSLSKEENFKIPKNIIQIKTSGSTRTSAGNLNDLSSEISGSPGTKTPTLVARLMGLDLLPGAHSPSSSSSSTPNPQGNIPHLHHPRPRQHIQLTKHRNSTDSDIAATRSLPETPRISSARRSDVDHHRLSLQINKENMGLGEELELPRLSFSKRKCDENGGRSPSHHARQIVKQVKESVSRKVGQDITNTLKSREQAREEFVSQFRTKKSPKTSLKALDESSPGKHSNSSYSSRLRFMDTEHKPNTTPSPLTPKDQNTHPAVLKLPPPPAPVNTQPQVPRVLTKPMPQQALPEQQELMQHQKSLVPKFKKATNEKFSSRLKRPPQTSDIIRNKQEESFIIRPTSPSRANDIKTTKSKKTHPLSSNLLNHINTVPNLLPVKTDPSPPATKIPQKQLSQVSDNQESKRISQISSCSSQRYKQEVTSTLATRESSNNEDKPNGASTIGAEEHRPEFQYITGILNRTTTGVYKEGTTNSITPTTTVSFNQWFSPTHPLDPSIFHHLEHHPTSTSHVSSPNEDKDCIFSPKNQLGHRWNRRLLFDLVDEVLVEILRPKRNGKKLWFLHGCCHYQYQGTIEGLTERVWKRVEKFPCAKCEVLEDIDGLIEAEDMEKVKVEGAEGLEEEGEGMGAEIEGNIWDSLVHETVIMVMDSCGSGKWGPCPST